MCGLNFAHILYVFAKRRHLFGFCGFSMVKSWIIHHDWVVCFSRVCQSQTEEGVKGEQKGVICSKSRVTALLF